MQAKQFGYPCLVPANGMRAALESAGFRMHSPPNFYSHTRQFPEYYLMPQGEGGSKYTLKAIETHLSFEFRAVLYSANKRIEMNTGTSVEADLPAVLGMFEQVWASLGGHYLPDHIQAPFGEA